MYKAKLLLNGKKDLFFFLDLNGFNLINEIINAPYIMGKMTRRAVGYRTFEITGHH